MIDYNIKRNGDIYQIKNSSELCREWCSSHVLPECKKSLSSNLVDYVNNNRLKRLGKNMFEKCDLTKYYSYTLLSDNKGDENESIYLDYQNKILEIKIEIALQTKTTTDKVKSIYIYIIILILKMTLQF